MPLSVTINLGWVVTFNEELSSIKSHDASIMWSFKVM